MVDTLSSLRWNLVTTCFVKADLDFVRSHKLVVEVNCFLPEPTDTTADYVRGVVEHEHSQVYMYHLCKHLTGGSKCDVMIYYGDGTSTRVMILPESEKDEEATKAEVMLNCLLLENNSATRLRGGDHLQPVLQTCAGNTKRIYIAPTTEVDHTVCSQNKAKEGSIHRTFLMNISMDDSITSVVRDPRDDVIKAFFESTARGESNIMSKEEEEQSDSNEHSRFDESESYQQSFNEQSLDDQFSSEDNERGAEDCNRSNQPHRITNRKRSRVVVRMSPRLMCKRETYRVQTWRVQTWEEMYSDLCMYHRQHGDCLVNTIDTKLGRWVQMQRRRHKKGELDDNHISSLESIGFVWELHRGGAQQYWNDMFEELKAYKLENGDCRVPRRKSKLGGWVHEQRDKHKKGELDDDQIRCMKSIGFVWDAHIQSWLDMFEELKTYKEENGDCHVPLKEGKLGRWVCNQREKHKKGELYDDQISSLESIGFTWDAYIQIWMDMFEKLKAYEKENGDCLVPGSTKKLGRWVQTQREKHKKGKLDEDQFRCLESIGFAWGAHIQTWMNMFNDLKRYKKENSDCHVPRSTPKLGRWVSKQREKLKKGKLDVDQIRCLDSIGFMRKLREAMSEEEEQSDSNEHSRFDESESHQQSFDDQSLDDQFSSEDNEMDVEDCNRSSQPHRIPNRKRSRVVARTSPRLIRKRETYRDQTWEEMCSDLCMYHRQHGDCLVNTIDTKLGPWVRLQREIHKKGELDDNQIRSLESIGFVWELREANAQQLWTDMFEELKAYKLEIGDCHVPTRKSKLGRWVQTQREKHKKGKLDDDPIRCLESIGFVWDVHIQSWLDMFEELKTYKEENGDCHVPLKEGKLGGWVCNQREKHKKGELDDKKTRCLESIGFMWESRQKHWMDMFEKLKAYKKENGDCLVPARTIDLGWWVRNQRRKHKKGELEENQFRSLDSIGFAWGAQIQTWMEMFEKLKTYEKENGDCLVPGSTPKLGRWVQTQRERHKKGELDEDQFRCLESIGFMWKLRKTGGQQTWIEMFEGLKAYKEDNGDCLVPGSTMKLGRWVQNQREKHKKGKLDDDQISSLESLGFVWDAQIIIWMEMFEKLKAYKEDNGTCLVPASTRKLGRWVQNQREKHKKGELDDNQIRCLDSIGFVFDAQIQTWMDVFDELKAYKKENGDCLVPASTTKLGWWVHMQRRKHKKGELDDNQTRCLESIGFVW